MNEFENKAKNFYVLGRIAEKLKMYSEAASNYFKALAAINDFLLDKINLKANDHSERFSLLKINFPIMYELTDRLFVIYRRTYTQELNKEEIDLLKNKIKEAFKNAKISVPTDEEIERYTKKLSEK